MQVKIARPPALFSTQTTVLVDLPDLPAQVVQVWAVYFDIASFSDTLGIAHALYHDINLGSTRSVNEVTAQWLHAEQPLNTSGLGQPHLEVRFWPTPYELIGTQRWDIIPAGGATISAFITIHYTIRIERNPTKWNLLRANTSFERD